MGLFDQLSQDAEKEDDSENVGGFFDDISNAVTSAVNTSTATATDAISASASAAQAQADGTGDVAYASIAAGWLNIEVTGYELDPSVQAQYAEWISFSTAWEAGAKNYAGLPEQQSNLASAQAAVTSLQAKSGPTYKGPAPKPAPGPAPAPQPAPKAPAPSAPKATNPNAPKAGASAAGLLHLSKTALETLGVAILGAALVGFGLFYHTKKR